MINDAEVEGLWWRILQGLRVITIFVGCIREKVKVITEAGARNDIRKGDTGQE